MSITASYRRLPPDEFEHLLSDPKAAAEFGFVDLDELELFDDEEDFDSSASDAALEENGRYLDIYQDWHALHFLLTGKAEMDKTDVPPPLGNVVLGGTETKWEATYGKVRYLTPEEVKDVAMALQAIKEEDLRHRDLTTFTAANLYTYRDGWSTEDLERLMDVFTEVRDFFSKAAREGDVVLLSSD
ncbi:MAG: YfbM family protein [Armatimonadetes bacterium]|nr:YfbM family protein [Armatimonadota bacterium]